MKRRRRSGICRSIGCIPFLMRTSLGFRSGFVISKDRHVVTNFFIMLRAYNMILVFEQPNTYTVEFVSSVTDYIMRNGPSLSSKSWSK